MFYFIYFELAGKAVNVEDTDIPGLLHEMIVLLEEEETMEETTVRATCFVHVAVQLSVVTAS